MKRVNAWNTYDSGMLRSCMDLADDYKDFLDHGKTERECVDRFVNEAERNGYIELSEAIRKGMKLSAGDRVYSVWMNKSMVLFEIGAEPLESGLNILGAHIDSPRLDIKQNPMYEDNEIAFLDTHYYGGIKKYQYVTIPLAIHGVIVKKNGETVILRVGEDEDDPVFFISDLLIHLSQELMTKKASEVVAGEALDLVIGHKPFILEGDEKESKKDEDADETLTRGQEYAVRAEKEESAEAKKIKGAVRRGILAILKDEYEVEEDDLISAELEIVPAGKTRDAGLDRSMILGYGQDDRVCAYPSMRAICEVGDVERTSCCILVDKEEIGSVGATGMRSHFFENAVAEVMNLTGDYSELKVRRCLANSCMLSSDVSAGFDPNYASAFEKKNAAYLGCGLVFNKFTGSRGKSGSNDANAEYVAEIRRALDEAGVVYQTAELGRVDLGGRRIIKKKIALYGMNVIDSGVAVLNMHAPWEATSKADIYEALKGYIAFLEKVRAV